MAIISISRIQVRRGLKQDLPQLASGELGWAIDTRQLFIGNGSTQEGAPILGNTEILTQFSNVFDIDNTYTFKGNAAGYVVQTGPTTLNPIARSMQDKFDDIANVRDFGAKGDGLTDDTAAINRAITQLYNSSQVAANFRSRRTLFFPAGTYNVSGDLIRLVPYLRIQGDGRNNTVIQQTDAGQTCCVTTSDSLGLTGASMGTTGGILPTGIEINDVRFSTTSDQNIFLLDSVRGAVFRRVAFAGAQTNPVSIGSGKASVVLKSSAQFTQGVVFDNCEFSGSFLGITCDDNVRSITVNNAYFDKLFQGVKLGEFSPVNSFPKGVKITNSTFNSVAGNGIRTFPGTAGIVSSDNYYNDVGNGFLGTGSPIYPVIMFRSDDNFSFGDTFERTDADAAAQARVDSTNQLCIAALPHMGLKIGSKVEGPGRSISLNDNQVTPIAIVSIPSQTFTYGTLMEYSILRGSSVRTGFLKIVQFGTQVTYSDDFVELDGAPSGITLTVKNVGGINEVDYTSTSNGISAVMTYSLRYYSNII